MTGGIELPYSFVPGLSRNNDPLKIPHTNAESVNLIAHQLGEYFSQCPSTRDILIVCIGTDRSTGDALGPIVGSRLRQLGFSEDILFGTLDDPVHAMNLVDVLDSIRERYRNPFIVAVDACLGQSSSVGYIQLGTGPVKPGAGVNKDLPPVGDIHLTGIVNVGGFMEYFVLQNTRLGIVFRMAEVIADAIFQSYNRHRSTQSARIATID